MKTNPTIADYLNSIIGLIVFSAGTMLFFYASISDSDKTQKVKINPAQAPMDLFEQIEISRGKELLLHVVEADNGVLIDASANVPAFTEHFCDSMMLIPGVLSVKGKGFWPPGGNGEQSKYRILVLASKQDTIRTRIINAVKNSKLP